jgi:tRNA(fMet)-specific endonuclease VapC
MILLDTDHISILQIPEGQRTQQLKERLESADDPVIGTTIVTVEEQMRGWLAAIAKERQPRRQVSAYRNLAELFTFFSEFHLALWDEAAAERLERLPGRCKRIGMMDRKIAAICLANDALLLTANAKDFGTVPGLKFANWLD